MRILYIHHEYYDRWTQYGKEMEALGHQVEYFHIGDKKRGKIVPLGMLENCDMVWTLTSQYVFSGLITKEFIKLAKRKNIPMVTYSTISMSENFDDWVKSYEPFDWCFIHSIHFTARINEHLKKDNCFFMPLGFYQNQYFPGSTTPTLDVSFCGSAQTQVPAGDDQRLRMLVAVKKRFGLKVYGRSMCQRMGDRIRRYKTHDEQRSIYWTSKINLDLPYMNTTKPEYDGVMHLKNRIFEVPACERFLITGDFVDAREMFTDQEIMFYDVNKPDDLVDKVQWAMDHPARCEAMALNARLIAVRKHLFSHRFQSMFSIMQL